MKNLISILDLSKKNLLNILDLTKNVKSKPFSKSTFLKNKTIALIFAKPSLRTRVSFEVGISQLGGNPLTIKMDEISIGSRENIEDIANVLSRYVHGIVIRTFEQSQIEELARFSSVPIVNALSNEEHPCQIVADLFTISEHFKKLSGLKLSYIGDGNNVAHSLILGCAYAGLDISLGCPRGFYPNRDYISKAKKINSNINISIFEDPKAAVRNADIIYTDVWASMGQEKEFNKRKKIFSRYQVNNSLLKYAKKSSIVLHCLPAHKGLEISEEVFDRFSKLIYTQAENRLHAQKAILLKLLSKHE